MNNKMGLFIFVIAFLFFGFLSCAYSSEYHHNHDDNVVNAASPETANGTALAIAMSQLGYDWGTTSYQVGVGFGSFNSEDAMSIGFGKRLDRTLLNATIGREGDKYGYGLGVRFHF